MWFVCFLGIIHNKREKETEMKGNQEEKVKKYRHTWCKDDLRILFRVCKLYDDDNKCKQVLAGLFPKCSNGAIHIAVCIRYAQLNGTNKSWFASNVPKKWKDVWCENDYYRVVV